ncbi:MAG: hypothetical protein KME31_12280 [Tolypothrix carrinoi HA7290-LM1]|nr:hypothetical protein [Tolypothrix carrinoi HA7290-LM1]
MKPMEISPPRDISLPQTLSETSAYSVFQVNKPQVGAKASRVPTKICGSIN